MKIDLKQENLTLGGFYLGIVLKKKFRIEEPVISCYELMHGSEAIEL